VIVTDLDLPGVKGHELFTKIRARHPEIARRVAFTSSADAMPGGGAVPSSIAVRYLRKPFDQEALLALVRKVLRVVEGRPTWTGV
jgi:DNA-binding response OmpR family regulator